MKAKWTSVGCGVVFAAAIVTGLGGATRAYAGGAVAIESTGAVTKAATPAEMTKAVEDGTLKRMVTTAEEFKERYGKPRTENTEKKGPNEEVLFMAYDGFAAAFSRDPQGTEPFRLFALNFGPGWRQLGAKGLLEGDIPEGEGGQARTLTFPPEPVSAAEAVKELPKIDRRPEAEVWPTREMTSVPKYDPKSQNPFQVDLRMADLSKADLEGSAGDLAYATFGTTTVWPAKERLPEGFEAKEVMELGKNPGLGVRALHAKGITGKGVRIAVIDQPLPIDHAEFGGRIRLYEETNIPAGTPAQMHGPAVASIAAGKTVGVAPEAEVFFIAAYAFDVQERMRTRGGDVARDFTWYAKAVRRIVEINRNLPEGQKIRAISLSVGWDPREKGYAEMEAAANAARDSGVLVTSSSIEQTHGVGIHGLGREPMADPDKFESYGPGLWWARMFEAQGVSGKLLIPMDSRTTAGPQGNEDYAFYRSGGWSWITPYLAGVYALACQVKPEITPDEFLSLAVKTGRTIEAKKADGTTAPLGPIIEPAAIIETLQKEAGGKAPKEAEGGK